MGSAARAAHETLMADFNLAYLRTNAYEGERLSQHWADRGGETYAGISRVMHPRWPGWPIIDRVVRHHVPFNAAERAALGEKHKAFFYVEFWSRINGDRHPHQDVANEVYDTAVNCGWQRANEWLQQALNVCNQRGERWPDIKVDGIVGSVTLSTLSRAVSEPAMRWFLLQVLETYQRWHYVSLAASDPTQEENLRGWFRQRIQHASPAPG